MINVNDYKGKTDSETIENALRHKHPDGIILIPPRESDIEPERKYWLIDRAILLDENTTVVLRNCKTNCRINAEITFSEAQTADSASPTRKK